jgi:hypothetical protein
VLLGGKEDVERGGSAQVACRRLTVLFRAPGMQDQHPCMFVEYAPWAGVLISTNSTYPHGISRSRIFDRGAGGIVVSFSPEGKPCEVIAFCT